MTQEKLREILESHKLWLDGKDGGERANLQDADLQGADLQDANLRGADLQSADLQSANLQSANLRYANLQGADLCNANLRGANLHGADLRYADLRYADLQGADLRCSGLQGANLSFACLPLWCGGLHIKTDKLQMAQLAYHFCSMEVDDAEVVRLQNMLVDFANIFAVSREDLRDKKIQKKQEEEI